MYMQNIHLCGNVYGPCHIFVHFKYIYQSVVSLTERSGRKQHFNFEDPFVGDLFCHMQLLAMSAHCNSDP